jgi:hypothetical protein
MAMNLRLGPEAEAALRAESEHTGRSQQDILREAVSKHLGLVSEQQSVATEGWNTDPLIVSGRVLPTRTPYRKAHPELRLAPGQNSLDLLDRDDRF